MVIDIKFKYIYQFNSHIKYFFFQSSFSLSTSFVQRASLVCIWFVFSFYQFCCSCFSFSQLTRKLSVFQSTPFFFSFLCFEFQTVPINVYQLKKCRLKSCQLPFRKVLMALECEHSILKAKAKIQKPL